ncbi:type I DNA topoisomerase [candidate division WOR-3 bacterium]|uniref:DNA topoisomerase 1 n=1 Tax=candidate division WOR-3 bacterium TaxID=2052148 RepID=A0A660SLH3_UNCW3|nr:MAG: type I DNA topoisomerase [candidate division WOR-3 bacterium]
MARAAIIVESPTKARTIKGFVGRKFVVLSSKGHIKDLPKSRLGVDIENRFEPEYIVIHDKRKDLKELKERLKKVDTLYLACDPDREGEAIAFHLAEELRDNREIKRILFHEVTPEAIEQAIASPGEIDMAMVDAHRARRVLDRLVGYYISPLLWKIVKGGLSAGRVQSVALRLICEREEEIENFKPQPYWLITAVFGKDGEEFSAQLIEIDGERRRWESDDVRRVRKILKGGGFLVSEFRTSTKSVSPPPPFITSTLQQAAVTVYGFSAQKTMQIAQSLYEGVNLPDGRIGLITYMRTDSTRVAEKALKELRQRISRSYGKEYLSPKVRIFKDRKTAQGAHEAIRPTSIKRTPEEIKDFLSKDQLKLYTLIYYRFLASQMADAEYEVKEVLIKKEGLLFKASGIRPIFAGYQKIATKDRLEPIPLPDFEVGDEVKLIKGIYEKKKTQPPPRYSEASLIKKLEQNGIGRPSTYAKIISTLFQRRYVQKKRKVLHPTELGRTVHAILIKHFAEIFAIPYTAKIEVELDKVEERKKNWRDVVAQFYDPLIKQVKSCEEDFENLKAKLLGQTKKTCPVCGREMVIRMGRYGKFYACSGFPGCRYTESMEYEEVDKTCPKCGTKLVIRYGKRGRFLSCPRYPECRHTEPFEIDTPCPICGGKMIEQTFHSSVYYRCRECNYKTSELPEKEE